MHAITPLPLAFYLAPAVACPNAREAALFSFRPASPPTAFLAGNAVCGIALLPASALLEAAAAAVALLAEEAGHAVLRDVMLPKQIALPERPADAAFVCAVSMAGSLSIRDPCERH